MSDHEKTNYFFRGIRKILVTPFKTGLDLGLMVAGTVMGVLVTVLTASLAVLWAVPATIIFLLLTVPMALYAGVCWLGGDCGSYQWFSYRMEMNLRSLHPLLWEWLTEVWWDMDPTQVATSRNLGMRAVHNLSALVVCLGILIPAGNVIRVRCDVEEKTNQELAKIRAHELLEQEQAKLREKIQRQQDFEKEHPVVTGTIKTFEYLRSKL